VKCVPSLWTGQLSLIPANKSLQHKINIKITSPTISSTEAETNPGAVIEEQLSSDHVASCHFALYNIRKTRPYLTQYATQLFVQVVVICCPDYCNAL